MAEGLALRPDSVLLAAQNPELGPISGVTVMLNCKAKRGRRPLSFAS